MMRVRETSHNQETNYDQLRASLTPSRPRDQKTEAGRTANRLNHPAKEKSWFPGWTHPIETINKMRKFRKNASGMRFLGDVFPVIVGVGLAKGMEAASGINGLTDEEVTAMIITPIALLVTSAIVRVQKDLPNKKDQKDVLIAESVLREVARQTAIMGLTALVVATDFTPHDFKEAVINTGEATLNLGRDIKGGISSGLSSTGSAIESGLQYAEEKTGVVEWISNAFKNTYDATNETQDSAAESGGWQDFKKVIRAIFIGGTGIAGLTVAGKTIKSVISRISHSNFVKSIHLQKPIYRDPVPTTQQNRAPVVRPWNEFIDDINRHHQNQQT